MPKFQVSWNALTKVATVQADGAEKPEGSVSIGTFDHEGSIDGLGYDGNHVMYHHVRDLLYFLNEHNMQIVSIVQDAPTPSE